MVETSLIEKIKKGGESELAEVYKAFRGEFLSWITKNFKCTQDDAKDIYQHTILIFYENILSGKLVELKSSAKTYLFAIGKNKALELYKASNRFTDDFDTVKLGGVDNSLEELDEKEDDLRLVVKSLDELGEPCSQLLRLYYYQKRSMDEIAAEMGYKNTDTAKSLKYKCMRRLKKIYKKASVSLN
ncbi:MAG: sigma-70 family RNA polymerase sigma factor [Bacteroidota bacterium]